MLRYDYIVAGSGLAGLYVAHNAAKYGKVALITKSSLNESNSYFAQGGIAAAIDKDDGPKLHFKDTIIAGRELCDHPAVDVLVNEGPILIQELIASGMHFDMEGDQLALGLEGGHHRKRILHAGGDATGRLVTSFMINKVLADPNIDTLENRSVIEIIKDHQDICAGLRVWNLDANIEEIYVAPHTFLAMGGTAAIYSRTTNPQSTVGDGIALAYQLGCEIADMEFIQFHPSAIYSPNSKEAFLVSEAVRGEGAHLYNQNGERFMLTKHKLAELAPRDIVAQSIYAQMRDNKQNFVWLSLEHLDADLIKRRFPTIFNRCKELGIDMTKRIPVSPASHYMVGGVRTDLNCRTNIKNLYICGELASSGIMGANRLASNSLIECLVFGKRAIEASLKDTQSPQIDDIKLKYYCKSDNHKLYIDTRNQLAELMTTYAGIIRNETLLKDGLNKLEQLENKLPKDKNEYYTHISYNMLVVARLIINSAIYRKESRGGHFRDDYPSNDDNYLFHIVQTIGHEIRTASLLKGNTLQTNTKI